MFFNNNRACCQNNNWEQENYDNMNQCGCGPIIEQPIERCVERNICHKVEQE